MQAAIETPPPTEVRTAPQVIAVPEMAEDEWSRHRAERLIRSAGAIAVDCQVTTASPGEKSLEGQTSSLMDAIHQAAAGDRTAVRLIEANASTDTIERTIKAGHIMKVGLEIDGTGRILQHGQYTEAIYSNTLKFASRHPEVRARSRAETRNGFRIEDLNRQGYLDDYYFVVISRCAEMSDRELEDNGFFPDTKTCVIQATTAEEGRLTTESAFVAGVERFGGERHDCGTVVAMGEALGQDYKDKTPAQIIDSPTLVHKSLMPDGAVDLVKLYDRPRGTFFGQNKPQENYQEFKNKCQLREQGFKPKIDEIVRSLILEAPNIQSPQQAAKRLHELSERLMVEHAITDSSIDPKVFGQIAAGHIEIARWHMENGNAQAAGQATSDAQKTARSNSCPGVFSPAEEKQAGESANQDAANGDCEFTSRVCPECGAKNVKTTVTKNRLTGEKTISGKCGCKKTYSDMAAAAKDAA